MMKHLFTARLAALLGFFIALTNISVAQQKTLAWSMDQMAAIEEIAANAGDKILEIDSAINSVQNSNVYKTIVDGNFPMPFGILPKDGDRNYALYVDNMDIDPVTGMSAEVYMRIRFKSDKILYFMAENVPLSNNGRLSGDLNLVLLETITVGMGQGFDVTFNGVDGGNENLSFVTFNCEGFKELYVNGNLTLNKEAVVKHDKSEGEEVSLDFFLNADRLLNLVIELDNIPALEFKQLPGFKCEAQQLVLDLSDIRNAPDFKLPGWYVDSLAKKGMSADTSGYGSALWQGVYMPSLEIEIPRRFSEGSDNNSIVKIVSRDIIIDQFGVTALTKVQGTSPSEGVFSGNIKSFKYRVDSLRLNVICSSLSKAGFYGQMAFPICKESSTVDYGLTISQSSGDDSELRYSGYAEYKGNLHAKAFGLAQLRMTTCQLDFDYYNKQFYPEVTMDGSITIMPKKKTSSKTAGNIGLEFGGLKLMSQSPYVSLDVKQNGVYCRLMTGDMGSKLGKLPIGISDAKIESENNGQRMGLGMTVDLKLRKSSGEGNESGHGFGATGRFVIWADRSPDNGKWGYDDFDLRQLDVDAEQPGFHLTGSVHVFDEDSIYGKGFCGQFTIDIIDKIEVKSTAIFGKVIDGYVEKTPSELEAQLEGDTIQFESNTETPAGGSYRYFFLDGAVSFSPAIPLAPGVEVNGFSGGVYYNMTMVKEQPKTTVDCKSSSGRNYIPQKDKLGLVAGLGLQSNGGGSAYNGEINLGIEFNIGAGGGLKRIATWGNMHFITDDFEVPGTGKLKEAMETVPAGDGKEEDLAAMHPEMESPVMAKWYVEYDFPNRTLSGQFDVYANVANGAIKGIGENSKVGQTNVMFSPTEKYVYIGRPVQRLGMDVFGLVKIESYLCVGNTLPDPPMAPMPSRIKGADNIDPGVLGLGAGFSFGSRMQLSDEGKMKLPLFLCKAKFQLKFLLQAGFDLLISQSEKAVKCAGQSEDRGINNWYATGQAYIYGDASLNLSYNCPLIPKGNVEIVGVMISTYMFAQFPRPTYLKGNVSAEARVVGKTFKGDISVTFGNQCGSNVLESDVNFIDFITPPDGRKDVPVGSEVKVTFQEPVLNFEYELSSGSSGTFYRAYIDDELIVMTNSAGEAIEFYAELSDDYREIVLRPTHVFPEMDEITVNVTVITQRKDGDQWVDTDATEVREVTFTTAKEKGYIPVQDVAYAYPLPDMQNFYKNEARRGYVVLGVIPDKPVRLAQGYEYTVAFYDGNNEVDRTRNVEFSNEFGSKNFVFDLPVTRLENGKTYDFRIMKSPIPSNVQQSQTQTGQATVGTVQEVKSDTVILEYAFRSSNFDLFRDKIAAYSTTFTEVFNGVVTADLSLNDLKNVDPNGLEQLSDEELRGYYSGSVKITEPLLQFGRIGYANDAVDNAMKDIDDIWSVGVSDATVTNAKDKFTVISNSLSSLNNSMKDMNMDCLIEGNCSAQEPVNVPAGELIIPIAYHLPGEENPTATQNIVVDMNEAITLPYN